MALRLERPPAAARRLSGGASSPSDGGLHRRGVVYMLAVAIAVAHAYACLAFHALLAVYYAIDPLLQRTEAPSS